MQKFYSALTISRGHASYDHVSYKLVLFVHKTIFCSICCPTTHVRYEVVFSVPSEVGHGKMESDTDSPHNGSMAPSIEKGLQYSLLKQLSRRENFQ